MRSKHCAIFCLHTLIRKLVLLYQFQHITEHFLLVLVYYTCILYYYSGLRHQEINLGKSLKITSLIRIYQSPTCLHGIKPPFLVIDYKGKTIKSRKICNFLTSSWGQTSFFNVHHGIEFIRITGALFYYNMITSGIQRAFFDSNFWYNYSILSRSLNVTYILTYNVMC